MTSEIYEKAQILADAIAQSQELSNLRNSEKAMLENEEAQKIIAEFQNTQQRLAELQQNGQDMTEDDKKTVSAVEEKVEKSPLISAYLAAQDQFTEMLDTINALLAGAIQGDNNGCSSCGSDGCSTDECSCGGCS